MPEVRSYGSWPRWITWGSLGKKTPPHETKPHGPPKRIERRETLDSPISARRKPSDSIIGNPRGAGARSFKRVGWQKLVWTHLASRNHGEPQGKPRSAN